MIINNLHPQYIINEFGERTSVILPLSEFEELLEDLQDLAAIADRKNEPTIPHDDLINELKKDGFL